MKLQGIYQSKRPAQKATLLKQLTLSKIEDIEDVREHVGKMFNVTNKLSEMVMKIDPGLLSDSDVQKALRAESDTPAKNWCLDSGATSHIYKEAHVFSEIHDSKRGKLNLATNSSTEFIAKGTFLLSANVDDRKKNVSLNNVLQVPDLCANLTSVAKITDKNYDVLFTKYRATVIRNDGEEKLIADRIGDLCFVREDHKQECKTVAEESPLSELEMWHRRMGHLNVQDLRNSDRQKSLFRMNLRKCEEELECKNFLLGTMIRTSFPRNPKERLACWK